MSKIIIHNETDNDAYAIELVRRVIAVGRVSGSLSKPQYCYVTVFNSNKGETVVNCSRKKGTDTFTFKVYVEKRKERPIQIFVDDVVP